MGSIKWTGSGINISNIGHRTQEHMHHGLVCFATPSLREILSMFPNGEIIRLQAAGSIGSPAKQEVIAEIGVGCESKENNYFGINYDYKKHAPLMSPYIERLMGMLVKYSITDGIVDMFKLRFQSPELVEIVKSYGFPTASNDDFYAKFIKEPAPEKLEQDMIRSYDVNKELLRQKRLKPHILNLTRLINGRQLNALPTANRRFIVEVNTRTLADVNSPLDIARAIKKAIPKYAHIKTYAPGRENVLRLVAIE